MFGTPRENRRLHQKSIRSTVAFLLSLTFLGSAGIQALFGLLATPPTALSIDISRASMVFDLTLGILVLIYWVHDRPDYSTTETPLGVLFLGIELSAIVLILIGVTVLFSRSPDSVSSGVVAIGAAYVTRAVWKGKDWTLLLMKILTVIGIIVLPVLLVFFRVGNPLFPVFQLWYLTRPQISKFFNKTGFEKTLGLGD